MSKEKNKAQDAKPQAAKAPVAKPVPAKVPPLFRKIDWLVLIISFIVVWTVYLLTLAPELTLEDSGELCTASFYAGIPHPPGYPFWAIYSWFWTAILPFGNVAWRVEVGESFAAAMACGLVGFMVSRGSSMLIEGIEELKNMTVKWETAICMVSGIVAGLLLGFDGFMWKESVVINRISLFDVPWIMVVALCLMRWIYAPQQRRYLYIGMFFFGLCATIHQTMLVAAMGIEVCIAVALPRLGRDLFFGNGIIFILVLIGSSMGKLPAYDALSPVFKGIFYVVGFGSIAACFWLSLKTKGILSEWKSVTFMGLLWLLGAAFYLYEPISGMTDPPMQWGYPRTLEGFFHAISRGQYASAEPTDIIHDPGRFMMQLGLLVNGLAESFSWVYLFIALLPFFFLLKMQKRERAWIIGLASIYLCIGVLLTIIMNTSPERQTADESKVFFAASHAVVAIMIGYGLALMAAYMAMHYEKFRRWGLAGGAVAAVLALYCLVDATSKLYFGPAGGISLSELPHWIVQAFSKEQYGSPVFANLILLAMPVIFILALLFYRNRAPVLIALCLFSAAPVYSGLSHWYKSEQRNHWFGYWFGHDMFTPPFGIYPEIERNSIIFGGTDPGRFCPTYMIFCESFIPHNCQPVQDQKFDRRDVYLITQNALADGTYLDYLRAQYNRSAQQDPPFFREFLKYILGIPFGADSSFVRGIADAAYTVLDVPFTKFGAHVEARRRAQGVYPPNEIYIPSPEDAQNSFQEYAEDVQRRAQLGQLQPGESPIGADGRVQVSGQVQVMMINGLLCKIIFDRNPTNAFYVEESFPLDWMYPYETPSGIIMKINRNPLPSLPDEVFKKDHEFWSKYSERLLGNWITYDTSIKQIADFAEKVYVGNNYEGFKGDRKFIRDDGAQKAFSKLRSSIAGMYAWRLSAYCPPEYRPKNNEESQALIREADFAFKQSFAFCPYSPEAVFRYANFLLQLNRFDDALIVAQTCLKLDPYNGQVVGLVNQLEDFKKQSGQRSQFQNELQKLQNEAAANPSNFQNVIALGGLYLQMQDTNRMAELFRQSESLFDQSLANPNITAADVSAMVQIAARIGDLPRLEIVLEKLISLKSDQPEPYYDLAVLKTILGKNSEALQNLKAALDLNSKRLLTDPSAHNLLVEARSDPHFDALRNLPEFQKIVPSN
jgi:tetratricopeptide (TPR) repeat protein